MLLFQLACLRIFFSSRIVPPRIIRQLAWLSVSFRSLEFVFAAPEAGTAVTCSTKDAGQLAEQLGGPRRDSPSNIPLQEPHRLGMIWFRRKTWFVAMLSISCRKEQVTCRMVLKRAPTCSGAHVLWSGPPAGYGCFAGPHRCAAWPPLRPQPEVGLPRERLE